MNRLVRSSADPIHSAALPPPGRGVGGPARVLFLHGMEVGFATTTANLEHFAAGRADIDAVHVRLAMPRWLRLACTQSPLPIGELDYRYLRHMLFWRTHLRTLLGPGRPLPLDRFDVVHISTQQRGLIIRDFRRPGGNPTGTRFAVNIDATLRGWESMRALRRLAPPIDWDLEGEIFRDAGMVACATEWAASSCEREYGVAPERVVIHKPCARVLGGEEQTDGAEASRRGAPGHAAPLRLIFIGGDWADKGGARLVRWHQQRWADRAELHIVSGSAPANTSARNVVWHGRVPHAKLLGELLPSMDIFIVPTKWDTFMIAAQEAQGAGVPVVTTRTGGVAECVAGGVTGFLCDRDDDAQYIAAVERLMSDPSLRARMSAAGRERVRRDLDAATWHNHLLDQLVALADSRPLARWPRGLSNVQAPHEPADRVAR